MTEEMNQPTNEKRGRGRPAGVKNGEGQPKPEPKPRIKKEKKEKPPKIKYFIRAAHAIVKRHQNEVERLQGVIAQHEKEFQTETSIAKRGHHMACKLFRAADLERSRKIIAVYEAVVYVDDYKNAGYKVERIACEHDMAVAYVHRDMYVWLAEQYETAGNAGNAARNRDEAERAQTNGDYAFNAARERLASLPADKVGEVTQ